MHRSGRNNRTRATSCSLSPALRGREGRGEGVLRRDRKIAASSSAGFSIVEIVIVLMIISIMAAVAAPKFADAYMYHKVESAARRIKADLKLTRRVAMAKSQIHTFEFVTSTKYQLTGIASADHTARGIVVDLAQSPYEMATVTFDLGGDTSVSFNGHGIADSDAQIDIAVGGHSRQITLDAESGVVTIQ